MNKIKYLVLLQCVLLLTADHLSAQRAITPDDLANWKRISQQLISNNGEWIACKISPWWGDATVKLFNKKGSEMVSYTPADAFSFSASSEYLILSQPPGKAITDSLKLQKVKKEKMPLNKLIIRHVSGKEDIIDSINNYKVNEFADWMAYTRHQNDSTLHIRSLDGETTFTFPAVTSFQFAKKNDALFFVSLGDTINAKAGIYTFIPREQKMTLIKEGKGVFKQPSLSEKGNLLAFLYCEEKDSVYKALNLWLSIQNQPAQQIASRSSKEFPDGWVISEHGKLEFSENGQRLFFGTSPEPQQKDTTQLAENLPLVEIWKWDEHTQYTVQKFEKENDLKRTFRGVYHLPSGKLIQLAKADKPEIILGDKGNANLALLSTTLPYPTTSMWEGKDRKDYYVVSLENGETKPLKMNTTDRVRLSPTGKYAWWYAAADSSWYAASLDERQEKRLTYPSQFIAWNEENDVPDLPSSYGTVGWTQGDEYLLLYDRYDIWQADPTLRKPLMNLTVNGRQNKLSYRYVVLDPEIRFIDTRNPSLLHGFQGITKGSGYYSTRLSSASQPKELITGNYSIELAAKAKQTNALIYKKETFEEYPEIYLTDLSFRKPVQITNEGKQQQDFLWGTAELVSWTSLDGVPLEGVLCKPANFNPKQKYPMIVNFYERNSNTLHSYRMPEPHRSTVDYHMYNSNGYLVFNPDIRYKEGYPGESCFNCVMPGIAKLIAEGYVDEKAIAAQGHSWGGYQVAYLATRTNLFAAIESGAPVVNMLSAYGGIRWGSGRNRSFQYEHGQSRIGATPWETPLLYIENSPLFNMDKVTTPILIMHNDQDGHVPWYQGIEYFIALKRLQKPVWLLNYPGEVHWPMKTPNRVDFQRRMLQFFNHYLKGEPMPKWMQEGIPAVEQEFELGY